MGCAETRLGAAAEPTVPALVQSLADDQPEVARGAEKVEPRAN